MAKLKMTDTVAKMVDLLTPLSTEERRRAIGASLTLLGEEPTNLQRVGDGDDRRDGGEVSGFPPRAQAWMRQYAVSADQLLQVFHVGDGIVEVIASEIPGNNDKQKTYGAYVLAGIAKLLETGNPSFDDRTARALCKSSGCLNATNHAAYLSDKGNEFTGTKEKGWMLTAPGLKRGAEIVRELNKVEK
jgi:hypothetical protein